MVSRKSPAPAPLAPKLPLTPAMIEKGIERLGLRIAELRAFDPATAPKGDSPELRALSAAIKDTLERYFGENTSALKRFEDASSLHWFEMVFSTSYSTPVHKYIEGVTRNIASSVALLQEAQRVLRDDLEDAQPHATHDVVAGEVAARDQSRRVFVVHGHDDGAREALARFLEKLGFEAVILHEQANRGGTVIEKIEAQRDVGFAVVLLTPDDVGRSVKEEDLKPRARQNVLLELGYFLGYLGRKKVCTLKRGDVDIPSDFAGVVWERMDETNGWKQALGRELDAAGYEIDWNKVMRS